jgi:hypothetical protein
MFLKSPTFINVFKKGTSLGKKESTEEVEDYFKEVDKNVIKNKIIFSKLKRKVTPEAENSSSDNSNSNILPAIQSKSNNQTINSKNYKTLNNNKNNHNTINYDIINSKQINVCRSTEKFKPIKKVIFSKINYDTIDTSNIVVNDIKETSTQTLIKINHVRTISKSKNNISTLNIESHRKEMNSSYSRITINANKTLKDTKENNFNTISISRKDLYSDKISVINSKDIKIRDHFITFEKKILKNSESENNIKNTKNVNNINNFFSTLNRNNSNKNFLLGVPKNESKLIKHNTHRRNVPIPPQKKDILVNRNVNVYTMPIVIPRKINNEINYIYRFNNINKNPQGQNTTNTNNTGNKIILVSEDFKKHLMNNMEINNLLGKMKKIEVEKSFSKN